MFQVEAVQDENKVKYRRSMLSVTVVIHPYYLINNERKHAKFLQIFISFFLIGRP